MSDKYKEGESFRAKVPFETEPEPVKVYIMNLTSSGIYIGKSLIIYKFYSTHQDRWREHLCYDHQMDHCVEMASLYDSKTINR